MGFLLFENKLLLITHPCQRRAGNLLLSWGRWKHWPRALLEGMRWPFVENEVKIRPIGMLLAFWWRRQESSPQLQYAGGAFSQVNFMILRSAVLCLICSFSPGPTYGMRTFRSAILPRYCGRALRCCCCYINLEKLQELLCPSTRPKAPASSSAFWGPISEQVSFRV